MTELISGSQIQDWLRCQRLYHYAHDRGIAPVELPWPLALGRTGHTLMASYYEAIQAGLPHAEAVETVEGATAWRMDVLKQDPKVLGTALQMVRYYWAAHPSPANWRVLAVEAEHRLPRAGWTYVATLDLLAEDRATGHIVVVDHRFLYGSKDGEGFYTAQLAKLDPQLARYALAAELAGYGPVRHAVRNMISTAPIAVLAKANRQRTKRVPIELTAQRIAIVAAEMERTAHQILAWRALPMTSRRQLAVRTVIPGERYPSCKTCPFLDLCTVESWGEDSTELEAKEYGPSDYGGWEQ